VSLSPLTGPRENRRAAERRQLRRRAAIAGTLLLLAAAGGALVLVVHESHARRHRAIPVASAAVLPAAPASAGPPRSPIGLVLGHPPLALAGLGAAAVDPLRLSFRHPPRAGLLFDVSSGRVLWQRNALRRLRVASLTKMMTAFLVVRSASPSASVRITKRAVETPGSKVGVLPVGRQVRLESMLYGLLLPSGNDAATALAERVSGSVAAFVERMNVQAAKLGLGCTRFSSPSGYFDEGNFSCAADLAVLAHADLAETRIARVARAYSAILPFPIKGGKLFLYNNNPMLIYGYPGATGLKTGYTVASGRCLVATAERHGVRLGAVVLDSPAPGTQARQLLDLGFTRIYHQAPVPEPPMPPGA
jgi:serine-type D-Ala-D-Ala carboxypeptidase (penicillin-binding protein 5/6)